MKIKRTAYDRLLDEMKQKEISIILGPRQVGKTFLLHELEGEVNAQGLRVKFYNLEIPTDIILFNKSDKDLFEDLSTDVDILLIDEFHYLKNASKLFKAIYDSARQVKIFASGSSSIEIHKHLRESLAGRRLVTKLAPLSYQEFLQLNVPQAYEQYVIYGGLPGLIHTSSEDEKMRLLQEILETYIQKDIKSLIKEENIRAFNTLLYLLAENQGSVSVISNLAREVGLSPKSINHYLSILEHTYVVFPLSSYARNIGNELKKAKKFYFYDTGIRNVMLKDFSPLRERTDAGALHESCIFLQLHSRLKPNMELKFWRNKQGEEIDFILLKNRKPFLIEVKTQLQDKQIPSAMKTFIKKYPETLGGIVFSTHTTGEREFLGKTIRYQRHESIPGFIEEFF